MIAHCSLDIKILRFNIIDVDAFVVYVAKT